MLISTLKNLGLNEKQAKLYLACLELGASPVYKIAQKAEIPRSTCYEILDILHKKGLVTTFYKKKVKYFNPEDPKKIIEYTKENIKQFEQILPEFEALYGSSKTRPSVRFYQGIEGMKIILQEILKEAKEINGFSSAEDFFAILGDYWPQFLKKRIKKKIPVKTILNDSEKAKERKKLGPKELRKVKIFPGKYIHHGAIIIWENKITMFSFKEEMIALVIESKELAQTQKAMFNFIWDNLK